MKAVILAAGEGLRCRPLTLTRSKVMLPVANRPLLEHIIKALSENGIKEVIFVVGYKKEKIMDYFSNGSNFGVKIDYVFQDIQLGTAHAIMQARNLVHEDFLVINGDNLIDRNTIADIIAGATGHVTLVAVKREQTAGYGIVFSETSEKNRVKKILEKPKEVESNLVNAGIYIFPPDIFDEIDETKSHETGEYAITDTIQQMIDKGKIVRMVDSRSMWIDAVYSWDLLRANSIFLKKCKKDLKGSIENGSTIKGDVSLGENSIIHGGCHIIGPVVIGKNCDIGPNTLILPSTTIGDHTSIASFVEIQNSIIMDDVRIGSNSHISNSIIGTNNSIGSHFLTDIERNSLIEIKGALHQAEVIGTVIGDNNKIGNRVLIKAGKMICSNCVIESSTVIHKDVISGSIVV
jgi:glucose-1-phosphate thymidylyltransferase